MNVTLNGVTYNGIPDDYTPDQALDLIQSYHRDNQPNVSALDVAKGAVSGLVSPLVDAWQEIKNANPITGIVSHFTHVPQQVLSGSRPDTSFGVSPEAQQSLPYQAVNVIGSLPTYALAEAKLGMAGLGLLGATQGDIGAQEQLEAYKQQHPEAQISGTDEAINRGYGAATGALGGVARIKALEAPGLSLARRAGLSGAAFAGLGGAQKFGSNLVAQQTYNPDQQLGEGVLQSAEVGGIAGAIGGAAAHYLVPESSRPAPKPSTPATQLPTGWNGEGKIPDSVSNAALSNSLQDPNSQMMNADGTITPQNTPDPLDTLKNHLTDLETQMKGLDKNGPQYQVLKPVAEAVKNSMKDIETIRNTPQILDTFDTEIAKLQSMNVDTTHVLAERQKAADRLAKAQERQKDSIESLLDRQTPSLEPIDQPQTNLVLHDPTENNNGITQQDIDNLGKPQDQTPVTPSDLNATAMERPSTDIAASTQQVQPMAPKITKLPKHNAEDVVGKLETPQYTVGNPPQLPPTLHPSFDEDGNLSSINVDPSVNINRLYKVPYGAGSSVDGKTVYIDRDIPEQLQKKNPDGSTTTYSPDKYLAIHELEERNNLLNPDNGYIPSHLGASLTENAALIKDNINPDQYNSQLEKPLKKAAENTMGYDTPPDLVDKPYKGTKLKKIIDAKEPPEDRNFGIRTPGKDTIEEPKELQKSKKQLRKEKLAPKKSYGKYDDPKLEESLGIERVAEKGSASELAHYISSTAPNKFLSRISEIVGNALARLENSGMKIDIRVLHKGDELPEAVERSGNRGAVVFDPEGDFPSMAVYLKGHDLNGDVGTSNEVTIHELLHAALAGMIEAGKLPGNKGTPLEAHVKELDDLLDTVNKYLQKRKDMAGKGKAFLSEIEKGFFDNTNNAFEDIHELVSWAFTNRDAQEILSRIPYKGNSNAFKGFINKIIDLLGFPRQTETVLSHVINTGTRLLTDVEPGHAYDIYNPALYKTFHKTLSSEDKAAADKKAGIDWDESSTGQRIINTVRGWHNETTKELNQIANDKGLQNSSTAIKYITKIYDSLYPIKAKANALGLKDYDPGAPVQNLRQAVRTDESSHFQMDSGQFLFNKDGLPIVLKDKDGNKLPGLFPIIQDLFKSGDVKNFFGWMTYKRATSLGGKGKVRFSPEELDYYKSLGNGKEEQFEQVAKQLRQFHTNLLKLAESSGLIKQGQADIIAKGDPYYIPWDQEKDNEMEPFKKIVRKYNNSAWVDTPVNSLKGGAGELRDVFERLTNNIWRTVDASFKNDSVRRTLEYKEFGYKEVSEKEGKNPNVIRVMENGDYKYYQIDDPYEFGALNAADQFTRDLRNADFIKMMKVPTAVVRSGATVMPTFVARTFIKHGISAYTYSHEGFNPLVDIPAGIKASFGSDLMDQLRVANAGFGGTHRFGGTSRTAAQSLREMFVKYDPNASFLDKILTGPKWWQTWNAIRDSAENSNRLSTANNVLRETGDLGKALYYARDVQDYNLRGSNTWVNLACDVIPFLQAKLFSQYKFARSASNPRFQKIVLTMAAASMALYLVNRDNPKYQELSDQDKDSNWHVFAGDTHFAIPKPFEPGMIVSSIPERMLGQFLDNNPHSLPRIAEIMGGFLYPGDVPTLSIPSGLIGNVNRFGGPIETQSDMAKLPQDRYNPQSTSITMRDLGGLTGSSPKKLQYVYDELFSSAGKSALSILDYLDWSYVHQQTRPTPIFPNDVPVIGTFLKSTQTPYNSQYMSDLYKTLTAANQTYNSYEKMLKAGGVQEANDERDAMIKARPQLLNEAKTIKMYNQQIDQVLESPSLTSDQKTAQVNQLKIQINQVLNKGVPLVRSLGG